ncbi:MAG: ferrochelatase [Oligoflexales bacterium]|nr:ferrochelatase [Oligoflexales bacterium]
MAKIGVVLINIGSPDSPTPMNVGRYLREFLMDGRVIDLPYLFRAILVKLIIVPLRKYKSAKAYKKIWREKTSPLLTISEKVCSDLSQSLGDQFVVKVGMRYGRPNLKSAIHALNSVPDLQKIILAPLYPQYSAAATASSLAEAYKIMRGQWDLLPISVLAPFYAEPGFIKAFAKQISATLNEQSFDYLLFSYHGLPEAQIKKSDNKLSSCLSSSSCCDQEDVKPKCYRAQCYATTRLLARELNLKNEFYSTSFQSRLGGQEWIKPYTDKVLVELRDKGIKNIAIACPAFVADCLETLEEIAMAAKSQWQSLGGENLRLVPSLNSEPLWIEQLAQLIKKTT